MPEVREALVAAVDAWDERDPETDSADTAALADAMRDAALDLLTNPPRQPLPVSQISALAWALDLARDVLQKAESEERNAEKAEREDGFTGAHFARERRAEIAAKYEALTALVGAER